MPADEYEDHGGQRIQTGPWPAVRLELVGDLESILNFCAS